MRPTYRIVLALASAMLLAAAPLVAQKPTPKRSPPPAARADTATRRSDSTVAPKDSLTRFLESFSFRNLGPAAYSGRVTAIAVQSTAGYSKTYYIGAAGGGVWKTSNGGITWQSVSEGLGVQTIGDLAVAPSDTNVVWAGTGEKNSLRSQWWGDGVYKSNDGGRKWTNMGLKDTRSIGRIVIHPTNPDVVYVAALGHLWGTNTERGVYKTVDGGKTWAKLLFVDDTTGFVDLEMDPSNPDVLYAAAWHRLRWGGGHMQGVGKGSGIYKTADGGKSWTKLTDPALKNGLPTDRLGRIGLALAAKDPRVVYAVIQVDRGVTDPQQGRYGGVFRSVDAGATWTQVNDLQAIPHYYYDDIWVDPANADHVWTVSPSLLESKDGGKSFAPDSLHLVHGDYHALWIDPADADHLIIGNDGGVYASRDGGAAWEHMAIPIGQFYTVIVDSSLTPYQVCGGLQDNGVWCGPSRTRDTLGITDEDWYPVNGGDGMWVQIPANDPFTVYSGWQYGHLSRLDLKTWRRDDITPLALDAGQDSGYPPPRRDTTPRRSPPSTRSAPRVLGGERRGVVSRRGGGLRRLRLSLPGRLPAAPVPHRGLRQDVDGARSRRGIAAGRRESHDLRRPGECAVAVGGDGDRCVGDRGRRSHVAALRQESPHCPRRGDGAVVRAARPRGGDPRARPVGGPRRAARGDERHAARGSGAPLRRPARLSAPAPGHASRLGQSPVRRAEPATRRGDRVLPEGRAIGRREAGDHRRGG